MKQSNSSGYANYTSHGSNSFTKSRATGGAPQFNTTQGNQSFNPTSINKANVTLWKSNYSMGGREQQEEEKVENEYIENLRKQIYFMEMEMMLMKEREKEIEKSGGFSK